MTNTTNTYPTIAATLILEEGVTHRQAIEVAGLADDTYWDHISHVGTDVAGRITFQWEDASPSLRAAFFWHLNTEGILKVNSTYREEVVAG